MKTFKQAAEEYLAYLKLVSRRTINNPKQAAVAAREINMIELYLNKLQGTLEEGKFR